MWHVAQDKLVVQLYGNEAIENQMYPLKCLCTATGQINLGLLTEQAPPLLSTVELGLQHSNINIWNPNDLMFLTKTNKERGFFIFSNCNRYKMTQLNL